jgi:hypothetical protein
VAARAARQLLRERREAGPHQAFFEARNAVTHAAAWEREALASVLYFNDSRRARAAVEAMQKQVRQREVELVAALRDEAALPRGGVAAAERTEAADNRVPERLTRGPLDFGLPESHLPAEAAAWYASPDFTMGGDGRFELVNFIDGRRTVTEIRDALSAEYGPVAIAVVGRYLDDLARAGVVRWK